MEYHIEHRGLLAVPHLTSNDWDNVRGYPLAGQVLVDLITLYQDQAPYRLRTAWDVLWLLLDLYPLVVHHPRADED